MKFDVIDSIEKLLMLINLYVILSDKLTDVDIKTDNYGVTASFLMPNHLFNSIL